MILETGVSTQRSDSVDKATVLHRSCMNLGEQVTVCVQYGVELSSMIIILNETYGTSFSFS